VQPGGPLLDVHMYATRELKNRTRARLGVLDRDVVAPSMRGSWPDQIGATNRINRGIKSGHRSRVPCGCWKRA